MDLDKLKGIFVPLVTPVDTIGHLDESSLENLVNPVKGDVDGIVANGATAEFSELSREKRKVNLAWIVHYADGVVPVVANVTDNVRSGEYSKLIEMTKANIDDAATFGASAVMVCPYYYNKITSANIVEFTEAMADYAQEKGLPLILYNNPGLHHKRVFKGNTGLHTPDNFDCEHLVNNKPYSIPSPIVDTLSRHKNIVGIKDSSGNLKYFKELLQSQKDKFNVFQGSEKNIFDSYRGDIKPSGIVPSMANVAPGFVREVYDHISVGNQERMDNAGRLIYGEGYGHIIEGIKYTLSDGYVRNPDFQMISGNKMVKSSSIQLDKSAMKKFWKITGMTA